MNCREIYTSLRFKFISLQEYHTVFSSFFRSILTQKLRLVQLEVVFSAQHQDLNASNQVNIILNKKLFC